MVEPLFHDLLCVGCSAYMHGCASHVCLMLKETRRGHQPPWNWVIYGCEMFRGSWELNLGPLEDQPVLLTTEPSFQPREVYFLRIKSSSSLHWKTWQTVKGLNYVNSVVSPTSSPVLVPWIKLSNGAHADNHVRGKLMQKDHELEANLGYRTSFVSRVLVLKACATTTQGFLTF